jgi:hypothetical protein
MAKTFIIVGVLMVAIGLAWPYIAKFGLGHLPGDIRFERKGFVFYFPLTTGLIISLIISIILSIFRR